jgi:probable F420-dependent oxidoreductase
MKIDSGGYPATVQQAVDGAVAAEAEGLDGYWAPEVQIDALIGCAVAATKTERLELGTGITVAFARNPMTVAQQANDVQLLSGGRFLLGLGSQIKPHITRRFSMPWTHPAPRMAEFIRAIRAIWHAWGTGEPLNFEGEFYTHTLMTPFFNPGPNPHGAPKIVLAGVGPRMTEVAGEVADGIILHGFTTERYVREVTMPALERGFAKSGRRRADFEVCGPLFVVTGTNDEQRERAREGTKQQIAFYGSTPAYRGVLELHGWGDLQTELNAASKRGEWEAMGKLITDEILETFAVVAEPEEIPQRLLERYGDLVDRLSFYAPYQSDPDRWSRVLQGFRDA